MKKVLHVVRLAEGGMQKHVLSLISGLDPDRFCSSLTAASSFIDSAGPVECLPVEIGDNLGPSSLRSAMRIAGFARRAGVDIIHAHGYKAAVVAAAASVAARKPFVFTAHNLFPLNSGRKNRLALRFCASRAVRIIAVSTGAAERLVEAGVDKGSISVIPNGISLDDYNVDIDRQAVRGKLGVEDDQKLIVCVARLTHVKGVHILIESVPTVLKSFPNAKFVVAGSGPDERKLKMLARVAGDEAVSILGYRDDAIDIMAAADVVAVPSIEEGQSIVTLEAMALKRPVVASAVGGLTDSIQDGVTGLLVPPVNPLRLGQAILKLLQEPELGERLGRKAREKVESEYTIETMIDRTEELYTCVTS